MEVFISTGKYHKAGVGVKVALRQLAVLICILQLRLVYYAEITSARLPLRKRVEQFAVFLDYHAPTEAILSRSGRSFGCLLGVPEAKSTSFE